jgi:hypothetical protein
MAPLIINGLLIIFPWLLQIPHNFSVWLFRSFAPHSGWLSLVPSTHIFLFVSLCFFLFSARSPLTFSNLLFIMRQRSRAPCSCPVCTSEDLREEFQALQIDCRRMEERSGARHRELQQENQGIHEILVGLQSQL